MKHKDKMKKLFNFRDLMFYYFYLFAPNTFRRISTGEIQYAMQSVRDPGNVNHYNEQNDKSSRLDESLGLEHRNQLSCGNAMIR